MERDRDLQRTLDAERSKVELRRQALKEEKRAIVGKSRELANARRQVLSNLELEQKRVYDLVQQACEMRSALEHESKSRTQAEAGKSLEDGQRATLDLPLDELAARAEVDVEEPAATGSGLPVTGLQPLALGSPRNSTSLLLVNSSTPVREVPDVRISAPHSTSPVPHRISPHCTALHDFDLEAGDEAWGFRTFEPEIISPGSPTCQFHSPCPSATLDFHSPCSSTCKELLSPLAANSPLMLTRGLARQLLQEMNRDSCPTVALEHFGLGKGSGAWLRVEEAMRPHVEVDATLQQQWLEVVLRRGGA